jgi:WD40 repeat protein
VTQLADRDGSLISARADGNICTWNWEDGSLIRILADEASQSTPSAEQLEGIRPVFNACPMPGAPIKGIRGFCWADKYLISAGLDGAIRVWDNETGQMHSKRQSPESIERAFFFLSRKRSVAALTSSGKFERLLEIWTVEDFMNGTV